MQHTRLGIYGLGKLGLPLAASFAAAGVRTFGIDVSASHIEALQRGCVPFEEPGLAELLQQCAARLSFHHAPDGLDLTVSLIQVPTPSNPQIPAFSARFVVSAVEAVCADVRRRANAPENHLVVVASTVMPGTIESQIKPILAAASKDCGCRFDLAYVPDLVALGDVVRGFRTPPFLVIGADDDRTARTVQDLYDLIVVPETPRAMLSVAEAEITKVAFNFYLCFKVSYANMLSRLASHADGANVDRITGTISLDPRVGKGFLKAGMPFGGPCLPRDVDAMQALLAACGEDDLVARAVKQSNDLQYDHILRSALATEPRSVGVLGLAFKAGTDVTIESPSFELIRRFREAGVAVHAWDPSERARQAMAAEPRAAGARLAPGPAELGNSCDVVVLAVNDPALARTCETVGLRATIIDPWGLLPPGSAGVIRLGRAG